MENKIVGMIELHANSISRIISICNRIKERIQVLHYLISIRFVNCMIVTII